MPGIADKLSIINRAKGALCNTQLPGELSFNDPLAGEQFPMNDGVKEMLSQMRAEIATLDKYEHGAANR